MKRIKRSTLAIALLALVVIVAAAVWLTRKPANEAGTPAATKGKAGAPAARPTLTVTVAKAEPTELALTLAANGNVAAWQEASVGSESSGLKLAEVRVNVGDVVKKGQLLAVFSPETVRADIAQSRASLAEARATAADAAGNAARARTLQATGALSQQQINQYQTAEQTAKARVEAAEAVLAAQEVRGRNTQVLAPDDGVISSRTATVGSVVPAGTELFRLIRQGRLEWRAEVTSAELSRIAVGTTAFVVSASGAQVRGKVRSIAPTVDPQTRAALVYVDLPNVQQNTGIKAGMFARGDFELGRSSAPTVPQSSIVPRDGFNNVFVLQPDNRVVQLKVQTGRRVGERVEITSALPEGAQIVVQGAGFLNDGDLVRVVAPPAPAAAGARPAAAPASAAAGGQGNGEARARP
ncbi:efflux RND transporter periplasmic adaptor subunit [Variovorax sp. V59]|uniref:RND family efflux transporter MFP subunit n=1 Tax=Variovorax paradoxus TaxID=34073 RepID=A0AAE3Y2Q4_VARPD|nr:efflux RND transporter periplasmic adaptor subunit [Variovorax paradoxus]MDP9964892.1 RND family efflux transporter MFP subunit [Variovorax paradoxus]MDR6428607.1 RND family efflux transporter MFP subunit [Variovorax paradoxus]MDR6455261.1 RND family efflux transporter MFP subunit [Variovorax paradoxus]